MLLERRTIGCIDVVSSLKMKVLPTPAESVVVILKSDAAATLWQRYKVVTLQSTLQRLFNVALTSLQLIFWYALEKYLYGDNMH